MWILYNSKVSRDCGSTHRLTRTRHRQHPCKYGVRPLRHVVIISRLIRWPVDRNYSSCLQDTVAGTNAPTTQATLVVIGGKINAVEDPGLLWRFESRHLQCIFRRRGGVLDQGLVIIIGAAVSLQSLKIMVDHTVVVYRCSGPVYRYMLKLGARSLRLNVGLFWWSGEYNVAVGGKIKKQFGQNWRTGDEGINPLVIDWWLRIQFGGDGEIFEVEVWEELSSSLIGRWLKMSFGLEGTLRYFTVERGVSCG